MNSKRKILIAGGLVAAVAASGGAFTNSISTSADASDVAASGQVAVEGATVLDVDYTMTGTNLASVTVKFDDIYDGANSTFTLAVNGSTFVTGSPATAENGGVDGADDNAEGDGTVVSFTAPANTAISSVTATDIVVVSETTPLDDNAV